MRVTFPVTTPVGIGRGAARDVGQVARYPCRVRDLQRVHLGTHGTAHGRRERQGPAAGEQVAPDGAGHAHGPAGDRRGLAGRAVGPYLHLTAAAEDLAVHRPVKADLAARGVDVALDPGLGTQVHGPADDEQVAVDGAVDAHPAGGDEEVAFRLAREADGASAGEHVAFERPGQADRVARREQRVRDLLPGRDHERAARARHERLCRAGSRREQRARRPRARR